MVSRASVTRQAGSFGSAAVFGAGWVVTLVVGFCAAADVWSRILPSMPADAPWLARHWLNGDSQRTGVVLAWLGLLPAAAHLGQMRNDGRWGTTTIRAKFMVWSGPFILGCGAVPGYLMLVWFFRDHPSAGVFLQVVNGIGAFLVSIMVAAAISLILDKMVGTSFRSALIGDLRRRGRVTELPEGWTVVTRGSAEVMVRDELEDGLQSVFASAPVLTELKDSEALREFAAFDSNELATYSLKHATEGLELHRSLFFLGSDLDSDHVARTISSLLKSVDESDEKLQARFGGKRAIET